MNPPETVVETAGMNDGDYAGISSFQNRYGFVGQRFALFYFSTLTPGGHADFDYFRTRPDITTD